MGRRGEETERDVTESGTVYLDWCATDGILQLARLVVVSRDLCHQQNWGLW